MAKMPEGNGTDRLDQIDAAEIYNMVYGFEGRIARLEAIVQELMMWPSSPSSAGSVPRPPTGGKSEVDSALPTGRRIVL